MISSQHYAVSLSMEIKQIVINKVYLPSVEFIAQKLVVPSKLVKQAIQIEHKITLFSIPTGRRQTTVVDCV